MLVGLSCPRCTQQLKLAGERLGARVRCPACKKRFLFEASLLAKEAASDPDGYARVLMERDGKGGRSLAQRFSNGVSDLLGLSGESGKGPTDVSTLVSGALAVALTLALYFGVLLPLRTPQLDALLIVGVVPKAIVFLTIWSMVILAWKFLKIRRQQEGVSIDLLPRDIAPEIREENAQKFRDHVTSLPVYARGNMLALRIARALDHLRGGRTTAEVAGMLNTHAEVDSLAMEASYSMLKAFIWAVPILGFIGTVIGIGQAVMSLSDALQASQNIEALRGSLGSMITGLAFAFNTTLIALVGSILLMLPAHWLQKLEDGLANSVNEYCSEELLARMEGEASSFADLGDQLVEKAVQAAMASQVAVLDAWSARLAGIGDGIVKQVANGLSRVAQEQELRYRERSELFNKSLSEVGNQARRELEQLTRQLQQSGATLQQETAQRCSQLVERIGESGRDSTREIRETLARSVSMQEKLFAQLAPLQEKHEKIASDMLGRVQAAVEGVQKGLGALQERHGASLDKLTAVIENDLGSLSKRAGEGWERVEQGLQDRYRAQAEVLSGSMSVVMSQTQAQLEGLVKRMQESGVAMQKETAARFAELLGGMSDSGRKSAAEIQQALSGWASAQERQQATLTQAIARVDLAMTGLQKSLDGLHERHAQGLDRLAHGLGENLTSLSGRMGTDWERLERNLLERQRGQMELFDKSISSVTSRAQEQIEAMTRRLQESAAKLQEDTAARSQDLLVRIGDTGRDSVRELTEALSRTVASQDRQNKALSDTLARVGASASQLEQVLSTMNERHAHGLERLASQLGENLVSLQERAERESRQRTEELEETSTALRRAMGELESRARELSSSVTQLVPSLEQQAGRLHAQLTSAASSQVDALGRSGSALTSELRAIAQALERTASAQAGRMEDSLRALQELQTGLLRSLPESLAAQRAALQSSREQCERLVDAQRKLADNLEAVRSDHQLGRTLSDLGGIASTLSSGMESLQRRMDENGLSAGGPSASTSNGKTGFRKLLFGKRSEERG